MSDERSPIYIPDGGEGIRNVPRRLVATVELPDRRNIEWKARNRVVEQDIREAMAQAALALHKHYMVRYSNLGFTFNPDDIEYDFVRLEQGLSLSPENKTPESLGRSLVASILIRR